MSSFNWSPKQQAAIEVLNTDVLVSASAGAGKTTVLIGRLIKRIEIDRISLNEVVAITFTELAATEMRKRLAKQLSERYEATHDEHMANQLSLLPSAYISTIHAFCLKLIENYAYVINLDPEIAQNVLDEASSLELIDEAFHLALNEMIKQDDQGLKDLALHFDRKPENLTQLKEAVIQLMSKMNTLKDPRAWFAKSLHQLQAQSYEDLEPKLKAYLNVYYAWKIEDLIQKGNFALQLVQNDPTYQTKIQNEGRVETNCANLDKAIHSHTQRMDQLVSVFRPMTQAFNYAQYQREVMKLHTNVTCFNIPTPKASKAVEKAWNDYTKAYDRLVEEAFEESDWFKDLDLLRPRLKLLGDLSFKVKSCYQTLKRQAKVMDFDDMEHYAIEILKEPNFKIADQFKAQLKEIMVDEFQDTNELQNELVELLSNGHNIFRVGDVKQSIYRFRNAQPSLMQNLMQKQDETHQVLYLDENYRSQESIVDFNNVLFDQLMNVPLLESRYSPQDFVKIGIKRQKGGDPVEVHYLKAMDENVNEDNGNENNEDVSESIDLDASTFKPKFEKDDSARPKVMHIINTILEMMHQKDSLYPNYKDYVVLVRSNLEKALLKEQFEKAHIPHHISTKSGFFNAPSIQDVLLVLNFLVNPYDDLNFVGLLLSKFVGLTENQVSTLAIEASKGSYYSRLQVVYPDVYLKLDAFKQSTRSKTLTETLRLIYRLNDYYEKQCSMAQRVNLDYLFEKAGQYTRQSISLTQFVLRIKHMDDSESSEAIPFTEEDNVVRVMTIHQSKGLEFKVVFFFTRLLGSVADNKAALLADSELGFMLKTIQLPQYHTRTNPVRLALEMKNTMDDVQEQVRLMYVALTRAEKKLIIVDSEPAYRSELNTATHLNAVGSTRLLYAALQPLLNQSLVQIKTPLNPDGFFKLEEKVAIQKSLNITIKDNPSIEFKTPSSTHVSFTQVHLNFNSETGTNHGTLMHALFEDLPRSGWTQEMIKALMPKISDQDVQSVLAFEQDPIYQAMLNGQIKREFAFHSLKDNIVLHGYMDLISVCEDTVYLVDYKTDRVNDPNELIEAYREQLLGYADVLGRMYPNHKIYTYAYSIVHEKFVEIK